MTLELADIQAYCLAKPGTSEDIKWDDDLVLSVVNKMYVVLGIASQPPSICFKTTPEAYEYLTGLPGIKSAPYLGRYKWVQLESLNALPEKQLLDYIDTSYELIKNKLSKKVQKSLGA